jgi:hypothetical protein
MSLAEEIPQPTTSQLIKSTNYNCLLVMKEAAKRTFELFWHADGKTPQEVADDLGTGAALGFVVHAKLQELIYTLDNSWVPLMPTHVYTPNPDGSVTIGEIIPVKEPAPEEEPV